MLLVIKDHLEEVAALILFSIGFSNLLLNRNMIKKIIGFSMMDSAIYLFLASYGYIAGRLAPIMESDVPAPSVTQYVNPLPAGLVLTGIVVSVSTSAIMLALTVRLYRRYHTLDIDKIALLVKEADEA
ncbi:MAG: cation:proton antiporter subunit C [Clostridia bacterium]|nr:cation:proton antiporter subunit C [Clostridia bacterium]